MPLACHMLSWCALSCVFMQLAWIGWCLMHCLIWVQARCMPVAAAKAFPESRVHVLALMCEAFWSTCGASSETSESACHLKVCTSKLHFIL